MIGKSEWQGALEELTAEERRLLGGPPTADEVLAYMAGELPAADEERVRRLLLAYPEMARAATVPFPEEGEMPAAELDRHWAAFRSTLPRKRQPRGFHYWAATAGLPLAAAVALTFGLLLWRANVKLQEPRVVQVVLLEMDGFRGQAPGTIVRPAGEATLLALPVIGGGETGDYRVELMKGSKRIWRSEVLHDDSGTFSIVVPSKVLQPGSYRLVLYTVDGKTEKNEGTYSLKVPAR